ncbi:MAG: MASE1 domain-containing protein [Magnetospirillum sp.]|nr:MASE1 domain-containing protein [Magnetospirillum sp.]
MASRWLLRSPVANLLAVNLAAAAAYAAAGWLGFQLSLPGNVASPVWPPSGLMLAAVVLYGRRLLPGVAAGTAIFGILHFPEAEPWMMLFNLAGATLEPLIAATIIRSGKVVHPDYFADGRSSVIFVAAAAAGTGVAARPYEALLVLGLLPVAGGILFALHLVPDDSLMQMLEMLAVPTLVLAAYRFHTAGATVAIFLSSAAAVIATRLVVYDHGSLTDALLQLQFFLATSGGMTLLLASERADRLMALSRATEAQRAAEDASHAKSAFLANMSHELRTPLNAVIGFSDMMDHQVFGPLGHPKYREYVSYIASSGTHLLTLISDILDMSKVEAGKVALRAETMAVADVLNDAAIMIAPRATEAGVTLVQEASGGTHFHVDRRYALQVALNLISNAINFTPRGGTIWLDVVSAGEQAGFRVRDTGVGLAPEDIPAVLQPFGQMRNPGQTHGEGVGLGLPLAKKLVELHGGRLFIDSTLGRGTTVTAVFPGPARQGEGRSRRG